METDLIKIKKIATEKEDENWEFRSFLKGCYINNLDSIVHRIFKQISGSIDCTNCGNCCRVMQSILEKNDITKLSKSLNILPEQFKKEFITKDEDGDDVFNKLDIFPEDYRKEGDILSPYKLNIFLKGQLVQIDTTEISETNVEMPEGIFDLPEEIINIANIKKDANQSKLVSPASMSVKKLDPSTFPVDLSPSKWNPADIEKYSRLNQNFQNNNVQFEGKNAVIVGISTPQAQRAGLEALLQGGTAMDAALTTSLTQNAFLAGSGVSYSGNHGYSLL